MKANRDNYRSNVDHNQKYQINYFFETSGQNGVSKKVKKIYIFDSDFFCIPEIFKTNV